MLEFLPAVGHPSWSARIVAILGTDIVTFRVCQRKRWLLVLLSVFQPLGVLLCSVIAFGLIVRGQLQYRRKNEHEFC